MFTRSFKQWLCTLTDTRYARRLYPGKYRGITLRFQVLMGLSETREATVAELTERMGLPASCAAWVFEALAYLQNKTYANMYTRGNGHDDEVVYALTQPGYDRVAWLRRNGACA